jgi:hypothetical protein
MNEIQRYVLVATACMIFLMILFPPFHLQLAAVTENLGYGFLFTPPKSGLYNHLYGSIDLLTSRAMSKGAPRFGE